MTGAKDRMRERKMKNQPRNVTYTSSGRGTGRGQGSQACGWVRGHQPGGHSYSQDLPKYITASYFAQARAAEVTAMLRAVSKPAGSCHVFSALPKHMRRRAMSHDRKRLPVRLREGAQRLAERSQRDPDKEKKPVPKSRSRRARRRHGNLLLEFNRRQRKNKWLETHIWHAKRFHVLKTWSCCVPLKPTAKSFRASYRAMSAHALLQDLSYFCCLELQGSEDQILRALARLTNKQTGLSFAAVSCLSGARQGSVHLYKADQFPHGSLGPVQFLWRPRGPDAPLRQLWIWTHPALKQEVLAELQLVCCCSEEAAAGRKRKTDAGDEGPSSKRVLGDGTRAAGAAVRWESPDAAVSISDLTMEILRYRLIGPLAHTVLTDALRPASEEALQRFGSGEDDRTLHQQQTDVFHVLRGVCSTAELPAGCVLGLTVDDPRLTLPQKRGKAVPDLQQSTEEARVRELTLRGVAAHCSQSALWDAAVRERVTRDRLSDQELNRLRSELLVPGSRLSSPAPAAVPVLLVHQAGRVRGEERRHWGSGWDLLLPKGWGMAFWVPLVYRGVRVGGLHMSVKHSQFMGQPHFPQDYPDCPAGERFQAEQEQQLLQAFRRRPPSKRTNYIKHGCLAPFRCPWQQLTEEWEELVRLSADMASRTGGEVASRTGAEVASRTGGEVASRTGGEVASRTGGEVASQTGGEVASRTGAEVASRTGAEVASRTGAEVASRTGGEVASRTGGEVASRTGAQVASRTGAEVASRTGATRFTVLRSVKELRLLSAWVGLRRRRTPDPLTQAALQTACSRSLLWVRLRLLGKGQPALHAMVCVPTTSDLQLLHKDGPSAGPREPLHKDHLKSLREHRTGPGAPERLLRGVWPEPLPSVVSHCSRPLLGWVQQGDFSLAAGRGEALAFVSVCGLLHTLVQQQQHTLVLLRNPSSLQYRFAQIIIDT